VILNRFEVILLVPQISAGGYCGPPTGLLVRGGYYISFLPSISREHSLIRNLGTRSLGVTGSP